MDKKELTKKLNAVKKQIKANSKDAHFASSLIDELISLKGQIDVEPTLVHVPVADVIKSLKGETFEISLTKQNDVVYHTYGGYTIVADGNRLRALAGTLNEFIMHEDIEKELDDEEREAFILDMEATAHILNIPMFAFSDGNLKYELASSVIKYLRKSYEEALESQLQEETRAEDIVFEEAVKASEHIQDLAKGL